MVAREVFRYCETKKIEGKPWYAWNFPKSQVFWNLEVVPRKFSRTVRQNFFDWRTWFSVLRHGKFRYPKSSGRLKSLPTKFFSTVRPKKSTENRDAPLLNIKVFDVLKILKHRGGSPANFIGSKRDINSTEKSDITILGMKFFDSRTFLIYRSVPQRNFLALWDKRFSTECHDIPFFYISFFRYLTFETVWNIRWFPTKFFATVRQKNRRKNVICKKVSEIPDILNLRSRSQEIFAYCETKNFEWRTWFSVLMHRKIRCPKISGRSKGLRTKFFRNVRPKNQRRIAIPRYWA